MQHNGWDHGLKVTDDGAGLAGHSGGVLLRKLADQCGLTAALEAALTRAGDVPAVQPGRGRGVDGGSDRAGGHQHERYRGAGPARAGAGRCAQRFHGPARPRPGRHPDAGQGRAGPGEDPRARVGADPGHPVRVPVAGHRREGPWRAGWSSTWTRR